MAKAKEEDIVISVPGIPGGNAVDYLQFLDIPISVLNRSDHNILVDSIKLRFQPEWSMASCDAIIEQKCAGFEIGSDKEEYYKVRVRPTPLFMAASNYFDVMLTYRTARAITEDTVIVREKVTYVVIREPPPTRGQAFISYKDPEDAELKTMMKTITRRVGFKPYVAPDDARPGSLIWDQKIPPAIKDSEVCFVLWTGKTEFGKGVRKELAMAKKLGVRMIPLIEAAAPIPTEFQSLKVELTRFARESAPSTFSQTAMACL
jgi:hypothetical protein